MTERTSHLELKNNTEWPINGKRLHSLSLRRQQWTTVECVSDHGWRGAGLHSLLPRHLRQPGHSGQLGEGQEAARPGHLRLRDKPRRLRSALLFDQPSSHSGSILPASLDTRTTSLPALPFFLLWQLCRQPYQHGGDCCNAVPAHSPLLLVHKVLHQTTHCCGAPCCLGLLLWLDGATSFVSVGHLGRRQGHLHLHD